MDDDDDDDPAIADQISSERSAQSSKSTGSKRKAIDESSSSQSQDSRSSSSTLRRSKRDNVNFDELEKSLSSSHCSKSSSKLGSMKYSDIFIVEDDPFVVELKKRKEQKIEKNAKKRERRRRKKHRASMSQMIELSSQSYEDPDSRSIKEDKASSREKNSKSKKKSRSKKENSLKGLQNPYKFMCKSKKPSKDEEYEPTVDDLLALPTQEGDDGRCMDEILDEVDREIAEQREKHRKELESIEKNIKKQEKSKQERKARYKENSLLMERLWKELTQESLNEMFQNNLDYLKDIERGKIESTRHKAFFDNPSSRQGLMHTMITHPFSEQHFDWTFALMTEVWMSTKQLYAENNEYVWKVLLSECFIKFYMDFFAISKKEAEQRIKETPHDDDLSSSEDGPL